MIAKQSITLACMAALAQAVMLNSKVNEVEEGIARNEISEEGARAIVHESQNFDDLSGENNAATENQLEYGRSASRSASRCDPYSRQTRDRRSPDTCYDQYHDYPAAYSYSETRCRPQNDYGYSSGYHGSGQDYYAGFGGHQQPSYYDQSYRHETYPHAGGYGYGGDSYSHSHPHGDYPHSHSHGDCSGSHSHGGCSGSHSHGGCSGSHGGCKGKCNSGGNGSFDPFFTLPYYGTLNNTGNMSTSWNQCLTYEPNYHGGYSSGCDYGYSPHSHSHYTPDHYHSGSGGYDTYRSPNNYHCDSYDRYHEPSYGRGCNDYSRGGYSGHSHGGYSGHSHGGYSGHSHGGCNDYSHGGYSGYSNGGYRGCDGGRQQCTDYECICRPKDRYTRGSRTGRIFATDESAELQGKDEQIDLNNNDFDDDNYYGDNDYYSPHGQDPYYGEDQLYGEEYSPEQELQVEDDRYYQDTQNQYRGSNGPCTPDFCTPGAARDSSKLQKPDETDRYAVYSEPEYYDPIASEPKQVKKTVVKAEPKQDSNIFNWNGWGS